MRAATQVLAAGVVAGLVCCGGADAVAAADHAPAHRLVVAATVTMRAKPPPPLHGRTVVIDPGHQLGNAEHLREIKQPVPDGNGGTKACNTTGTATNSGYPEATFAFRVAVLLRARLEHLGARVRMTRLVDSTAKWGPCVDRRGRWGNQGFAGRVRDADAKISIHGDGAAGDQYGFHVIVASKNAGRSGSTRLAKATRLSLRRAKVPLSTYVSGGLDYRSDLATLNFSRYPTVMVELGNMRNADDAARMTSAAGRTTYAHALARGLRRFLSH